MNVLVNILEKLKLIPSQDVVLKVEHLVAGLEHLADVIKSYEDRITALEAQVNKVVGVSPENQATPTVKAETTSKKNK